MPNQSDLNNEKVKNYTFLNEMYQDTYFPDNSVDKCKDVLVNLCFEIEKQHIQSLEALYNLTHRATDQINDLQDDFYENDSELESGAAEIIAMDFGFIASAYNFENADIEEMIATREW